MEPFVSNDLIETLLEEETNLALHAKLCAQRYQQITDKIDAIDQRLDKMEVVLTEIKNKVSNNQQDNFKMFLGWASVIIVSLMSLTGYLITHYVFK